MFDDPIVKEVREAGAKMMEDAGNDLGRYFENLRKAQERYGKRLVTKPVSEYQSSPNIDHK